MVTRVYPRRGFLRYSSIFPGSGAVSPASPDVDIVVVGEINEWETSEYARDAARQKKSKALIILGHANSEEPGMKYLAEWLRPMVPSIKITFVPAGDPFQLM